MFRKWIQRSAAEGGLDGPAGFSRIAAMTMLLIYLLVEIDLTNQSYAIITVFDVIKNPVLKMPYFPFLTLESASYGWYPIFVECFFVLAMFSVLIFPFRRTARTMALLAILIRLLSSHLGIGVHMSTVYLVPFLLLALHNFKTDSQQQLLRGLVTATACMYFFSAIFKLNANYLGGDLLKYDRLGRSYLGNLHQFVSFPAMAWIGLTLEALGTLLLIGKYRRLALLATFTFHFGVSLWLTLGYKLQITSASLLLLFLPREQASSMFRSLCLFLFLQIGSHFIIVNAGYIWFQEYGLLFRDLHGILFSLAIYVFATYTLFAKQIDLTEKWSLKAAMISMMYAAISFTMSWPEPFGYTQYSGWDREYFGISLDNTLLKKHPDVLGFKGRWSIKVRTDLFENETTYLFSSQVTRDKFEAYFCGRAPAAIFWRLQTDRKVFIGGVNLNQTVLRDSIVSSRLASRCRDD